MMMRKTTTFDTIKRELKAAKEAEEQARLHGTEREWTKAYGAFVALDELLYKIGKEEPQTNAEATAQNQ